MKLLLLGASGQTGKILTELALAKGHKVNALVRTPDSMGAGHENLTVFQGSPLAAQDVSAAMQGCDAVVSTLNVSMASHFPWAKVTSPRDLMSASMANVTSVMAEQGVSRLVVMSSNGASESWSGLPGFFRVLVSISNLQAIFTDHTRQEAVLKGTDLDWTALRPVGLNDKKDKPLDQVIVSVNGDPKPGMFIGRRTVAEYILKTLQDNLHIRERPTLS